jgi:hypothetical protein
MLFSNVLRLYKLYNDPETALTTRMEAGILTEYETTGQISEAALAHLRQRRRLTNSTCATGNGPIELLLGRCSPS